MRFFSFYPYKIAKSQKVYGCRLTVDGEKANEVSIDIPSF